MVKLKRQTITFRNQPIGLIQRSNAVEQSFVSTAESINSLNKIVFDELAADAKKTGEERARSAPIEQFTTLGPDGNFKAYSTEEFKSMGSIGQEAYEALAEKRYMKSVENDIKLRSKELRAKYNTVNGGDQAFNNAMSDYVDKIVDNSPDEFKNIISDAGKEIVREHVADLTLIKVKSQQARNETMINEDVAEYIYNMDKALETGNANLIAATLNTGDAILKSAELHEDTSIEARSKNYAEKIRRTMEAVGMKQSIKSLFDKELSAEEVPALQVYLSTGFADTVLKNNEDLFEAAKTVRDNTDYYEVGFVEKFSKQLATAKSSILSKSATGTSKTKNAEKQLAKSKISIVFDKFNNASDTSVQSYRKTLEEIVNIAKEAGPNIIDSEAVKETYKEKLKVAVTQDLIEEIRQMPLSARERKAVIKYITQGGNALDRVVTYDGVDFEDSIPPELKKRIEEIKIDLEDQSFLGFNQKGKLLEQIHQQQRNDQQDELLLLNAEVKDDDEKNRAERLQAGRKLLLERRNLITEIDRVSKDTTVAQTDIDALVEKKKELVNRINTEVEKKNSRITLTNAEAIENELNLAITNAAQNVLYTMARDSLEDDVKLLVFENNQYKVNPKIGKTISAIVDYFDNPQNKEGVPQNIIDYRRKVLDSPDYFIDNADTRLSTMLKNLQSEITAQANAYKDIAEQMDLQAAIRDRNVASSEKTSNVVNDMLHDVLEREMPELSDSSKSKAQNLEDYILSKSSLEIGAKPTHHMYKHIGDGYLPQSFIRVLNKASSLNNEQLGVLITHIVRMQHGHIPGTKFKGSFFGYRGARLEGGDYKFKEVNDTINKLLSVHQISKLTGTSRTTRSVSADLDRMETPYPVDVEITTSEPLVEIYQRMNQQSREDINNDFEEIRKGLVAYMPPSLKSTDRTYKNTDAVIEAIITSTDVFKGGNIPQEIKELTDYMFRGFKLGGSNLTVDAFYEEYKTFLEDFVAQEYIETKGNILDFTNNGPKEFTKTRYALERYFNSPQKYYAAIQYINDLLPDNVVFDPETVVDEQFTEGYNSVDAVGAGYAKAYRAGKAKEQALSAQQLIKDLPEDGGRAILVAYPTASNEEVVYQAFLRKNFRLIPINTTDENGDEAPVVFSARSLNNALVQDGVVDEIFEDLMREHRAERERKMKEYEQRIDGQD
tara:strand:- start:620 stop:4147 length:3528 start_codon:yes stop_codon:yes gene_type:complete